MLKTLFHTNPPESFLNLVGKANPIKNFAAVIYASVIVPGKLFQPSLMFVGKSRRLPRSGAPESYSTQVGSDLDLAGEDCQGQTLSLITNICKLRTIKYCTSTAYMLSVTFSYCYAVCHHAESRGASFVEYQLPYFLFFPRFALLSVGNLTGSTTHISYGQPWQNFQVRT
jgi:hypothetical protein